MCTKQVPYKRYIMSTRSMRESAETPQLPNDVLAFLLLKNAEDALAQAQETLTNGFFTQDGPKALRALCSALSQLMNMKLTSQFTYTVAITRFDAIIKLLRAFLGKVTGWQQNREKNENVAQMCRVLESLLAAAKPPALSRQRAELRPLEDHLEFMMR